MYYHLIFQVTCSSKHSHYVLILLSKHSSPPNILSYFSHASISCLASTEVVTPPTPLGTGVIIEHLSSTESKSTSPHILPSLSKFIPTSITTASFFRKSHPTILGLPIQVTNTSASEDIFSISLVFE